MRLALGHALTVSQIFGSFKTKTLKMDSKECYEKFGCRNTERIAQQIFKKSLGLILDDVIDNNATFHLPLGGKQAQLCMDRVEGEEFKRAVQNGAFKDIDFLKSEIQRYNNSTLRSVSILREDIDKCFNIDIDIHQKEPSTIVVSGLYKGRDYVKIYKLHLKDFRAFVDDLKQREKFGNIHTIDSFDQSIKRELEYQWKL